MKQQRQTVVVDQDKLFKELGLTVSGQTQILKPQAQNIQIGTGLEMEDIIGWNSNINPGYQKNDEKTQNNWCQQEYQSANDHNKQINYPPVISKLGIVGVMNNQIDEEELEDDEEDTQDKQKNVQQYALDVVHNENQEPTLKRDHRNKSTQEYLQSNYDFINGQQQQQQQYARDSPDQNTNIIEDLLGNNDNFKLERKVKDQQTNYYGSYSDKNEFEKYQKEYNSPERYLGKENTQTQQNQLQPKDNEKVDQNDIVLVLELPNGENHEVKYRSCDNVEEIASDISKRFNLKKAGQESVLQMLQETQHQNSGSQQGTNQFKHNSSHNKKDINNQLQETQKEQPSKQKNNSGIKQEIGFFSPASSWLSQKEEDRNMQDLFKKEKLNDSHVIQVKEKQTITVNTVPTTASSGFSQINFGAKLYEKGIKEKQKHREVIEKLKAAEEGKVASQLTFKPSINKHSIQIIQVKK